MSQRTKRLNEGRPEGRQLRDQAQKAAIYDRDSAKQYVRRVGWLEIVRDYVRRFRAANVGRSWKYLTLPGEHASDIGLLWREGLLETTADRRLNVAICDRKYAAVVAASIAGCGRLLASSDQWLDKELTSPNSVLARQFPFDVINLDWCDSLMPEDRPDANLQTIEWVFRLQRRQSFLLLLTTRPAHHSQQDLLPILRGNLTKEPLFRDAYMERYRTANPSACLRDYTAFTQIVIPKAIAEWARYWGYKTEERFVGRYKRPGKGRWSPYEMICHSFEFERLVGTREVASKFEPDFHRVPQDIIADRLYARLSSGVGTQAIESYVAFLPTLLRRPSLDITAFLRDNPEREAELEAEAESLIGWCGA